MKRERDNKRIEKAIDELLKIIDDGYGNSEIRHILDALNSLRSRED